MYQLTKLLPTNNGKNVVTQCICCDVLKGNPLYKKLRLFLFETDHPFNEWHHSRILEQYRLNDLDCLFHRSCRGLHYISPTPVTAKTWKIMHSELKDINPKCPLVCLRVKPNKYVNEKEIWYNSGVIFNNPDPVNNNSDTISNFLNKIWKCNFEGDIPFMLNLVNYTINYESE